MKTVVKTGKLPILLWLDSLEEDALLQAQHLAHLPCAFHHIAIMADAHVGYGMPIGGVLATTESIIPNGVGVDIGCGMQAVRTSLESIGKEQLQVILRHLHRAVPLGFQHHATPRPVAGMPESGFDIHESTMPVVTAEFEKARHQLGTLGGGNHFIEIQQGSDHRVWLMVHSGSRNLGYQVAGQYNKLAVQLACKHGKEVVPKEWQLAVLPVSSQEGQRYVQEMEYCVAFARANRSEIMQTLKTIVSDATGCDDFGACLDIAHNYAAKEMHFDREVWVHRKGATRAFFGENGIIPGSQGSCSYLVRGLGNPQSFMSCSHGAGRILGRKEAQRVLDLHQEISRLNARGVLHSIRHRRDLDEAPGAYKDIAQVIESQRDLIEVLVELHPLAVVKG